jgi:HK97 gp10 family phage protein
MSSFPIQVKGLDELIKRLKDAPKELVTEIDAQLDDGSQQIAKLAINQAPGNTGTLKQQIGSEKVGSLDYSVFSNAEYSAFEEFGTGVYVNIPPGLEEYAAQFKSTGQVGLLNAKDAIFAWCKAKGIEEKAWYAIYNSIMTNGIHPQPFFFSALAAKEKTIIDRVSKAIDKAI